MKANFRKPLGGCTATNISSQMDPTRLATCTNSLPDTLYIKKTLRKDFRVGTRLLPAFWQIYDRLHPRRHRLVVSSNDSLGGLTGAFVFGV